MDPAESWFLQALDFFKNDLQPKNDENKPKLPIHATIPFSEQEYHNSLLYWAEEAHVDKYKMKVESVSEQRSLWLLILEELENKPTRYPLSREKFEEMDAAVVMEPNDNEMAIMLKLQLRKCLMQGLVHKDTKDGPHANTFEWADALHDLEYILAHKNAKE